MITHTLQEDFEHFLSYNGSWNETEEFRKKLFLAYEHGSEREDDTLRAAYIELSGKNLHDSDCSVHNSPAMRPSRCDCDA